MLSIVFALAEIGSGHRAPGGGVGGEEGGETSSMLAIVGAGGAVDHKEHHSGLIANLTPVFTHHVVKFAGQNDSGHQLVQNTPNVPLVTGGVPLLGSNMSKMSSLVDYSQGALSVVTLHRREYSHGLAPPSPLDLLYGSIAVGLAIWAVAFCIYCFAFIADMSVTDAGDLRGSLSTDGEQSQARRDNYKPWTSSWPRVFWVKEDESPDDKNASEDQHGDQDDRREKR